MEVMDVPPANAQSVESLFHDEIGADGIVMMRDPQWRERLSSYIGHRAIGVVYQPQRESLNYVPSLMPYRYDAMVFIDKTKALYPLHLQPDENRIPETYPFGF